MSKSIYDEAEEILLKHLRDVNETYGENMYEVVEALRQAQKQEKLLEVYQAIDEKVEEHNMTDSILRKVQLHNDIGELRLKIKTLKEG